MIPIFIPGKEYLCEETGELIKVDSVVLKLEHSLHAIAEWESKWKKSFLSCDSLSFEESISYVKCMVINEEEVPDVVFLNISEMQLNRIYQYINDSLTATTIREDGRRCRKSVITSEIVYYWMVKLNIPFECQYWHFSRLMTLINICLIKGSPPKKRSKKEIAASYQKRNLERLKKFNTKG